jgi:hypothetical protein
MFICTSCGEAHQADEPTCPHCSHGERRKRGTSLSAAFLLGAMGVACDLTSNETQPLYGAAMDTGEMDMDGDGFTPNNGDCDDMDESIHPEAEEILDDGVDQNCDGEDNT